MLKDTTIRTRLYGLVAISCAGLLTVQALAIYAGSTYGIGGPVYRRIELLQEFKADVAPPTLFARGPYVTLQEMETETNPDELRALLDRYRNMTAEFERDHTDYRTKLPDGEIKRMLESEVYPHAAEMLRIAREEYLPLVGKQGEQQNISRILSQRIKPAFRRHREAVDRLMPVVERTTDTEAARAVEETRSWGTAMIVVCAGSLVVLASLGWLIARGIVRATDVLNTRVSEMAGGASDLTARVAIDSRDELGQLATGVNALIGKIQGVVTKVRESSLQVLATASEIAATARQQEASVNGLSSTTTEVAAAVREISATGKELSGTMDEVNARANHAAGLATAGRQGLSNMEQTMQHLVESTASISAKLSTIREKADTINTVVTTITKVADQTNLLSINAAIEAEKAGEFGRGFLVVAREIRRLADQTAVATLDIENIVRLMQDAVATGVMQMDQFSDQVRKSVAQVGELNGQTGQVIVEVTGLSDRFRTVNDGMRNQAVGAGQINEAMGNVTGIIRQTASAVEEFNRATAHLRESIEHLNSEIAQFKV